MRQPPSVTDVAQHVQPQKRFDAKSFQRKEEGRPEEVFLRKMDVIVPWKSWAAKIALYYPSESAGVHPVG